MEVEASRGRVLKVGRYELGQTLGKGATCVTKVKFILFEKSIGY